MKSKDYTRGYLTYYCDEGRPEASSTTTTKEFLLGYHEASVAYRGVLGKVNPRVIKLLRAIFTQVPTRASSEH